MNKHGDAGDINVPWDAKYANYSLGNRKKGKSSLKHYSPNLFPLNHKTELVWQQMFADFYLPGVIL